MATLFKLISGEEVVATVVSSTFGEGWRLTDAVSLMYHDTAEGKTTVGFAPFMPYSDGEIFLQTHAVAGVAEVKSQLLAEYNRVFSKIILPGAGSIVK